MTTPGAEWMRKKRERLRAQGLCDRCGKTTPVPGKAYCEPCLEKSRTRAKATQARRHELGLCLGCGLERDEAPKRICRTCREATERNRLARPIEHRRAVARANSQKTRADKRARGECYSCKNPAVPGKTFCEHHGKLHRAATYDRLYGVGVRDHVINRDGNKCWLCGDERRLHIHHIDGKGARSDAPNNHPSNLVTLCTFCHDHLESVLRSEVDPERLRLLVSRESPFV